MDQRRIWSYYQNERPAHFREAVPRLRALFRMALRALGETTQACLNIGVGNGWIEMEAQRRGWSVASVDPDEKAQGRLAGTGIDARVGYIQDLPFGESSFDVVFASEVLEHLEDEELHAGLLEVRRCLRTGGLFVGSVPFEEDLEANRVVCPDCGRLFHRRGHVQSFTEDRVQKELVERGFEVTKIGHATFVDLKGLSLLRAILRMGLWFLGRLGLPPGAPRIYFLARSS